MTRNVLLALVLVLVVVFSGSDGAAQDPLLDSELFRAVEENDIAAIVDLLDAGADPNAWFINERMARGLSALIWAVSEGNVDAIEVLLEAGADPNVRDSRGIAALTWAVIRDDVEAIEALLNAGADLNTKNHSDDRTALHDAAENGHVEVVEALLDAGIGPNVEDSEGLTALDLARNDEVARILREAGGQ